LQAAELSEREGDEKKALGQYQALRKNFEESFAGPLGEGRILESMGRRQQRRHVMRDAASAYREAIRRALGLAEAEGRLARLYLDLGLRGVEIIFVDPTCGGAHRRFEELVPRISEASPAMRECLEVGRRAGVRDWYVRYVPLCHFRDYEDQVSETKERRVFHTVHLAPDFKNLDVSASRAVEGREKPLACEGCRMHGECEGIWKEYLRRYGSGELKPI